MLLPPTGTYLGYGSAMTAGTDVSYAATSSSSMVSPVQTPSGGHAPAYVPTRCAVLRERMPLCPPGAVRH
eukprot:1321618-Rhodomonas_salina.3